jgi:two-component system response regulator YesN
MIETKTSIEHMREIAVFIASSLMQFLPDKFFDIESSSDNNPLVLSKILKTFNSGNLKSLLCSLAFQICSELKKSFVQNNAIISKVNDYIAQNYQKNIRLAAIANHIHVNSSYLSRLYRQETGITITDAISRYRIEKAKEFLQNPEIKAYEVAYLVGFEDAAYFSLMFKRHTGCSPTEYRQLSNRE